MKKKENIPLKEIEPIHETSSDDIDDELMQWVYEMESECGDELSEDEFQIQVDYILESLRPYLPPDINEKEERKKIEVDYRECEKEYAAQRHFARMVKIGVSRRKKQRATREKRQKWSGLTREQLAERNKTIIEHHKKTRLSISGFAEKHAAQYGLKPRQVRNILKMAVGSLPG